MSLTAWDLGVGVNIADDNDGDDGDDDDDDDEASVWTSIPSLVVSIVLSSFVWPFGSPSRINGVRGGEFGCLDL